MAAGDYPETCPRCGGWVWHRPESCGCAGTNPVIAVAVAAKRIGRVLDEFDGNHGVVDQELWDALWAAVERLPPGF